MSAYDPVHSFEPRVLGPHVIGTSGNDIFNITVKANKVLVNLNGDLYDFDRTGEVSVDGGLGNDWITIKGSTANEQATLRVQSATLVGPDYQVCQSRLRNEPVSRGGFGWLRFSVRRLVATQLEYLDSRSLL